MSRAGRILKIAAISIASLVVVVIAAGVIIVQTQWFRDMVRGKITGAVETATGGKADIGSFTFDWTHLRAQIRNFTIHGLEQPNQQPLFHANLVQVDLKLLSPFAGFVDIAYLLLDTPHANVIVFPDGSTNIPAPKVPAKSSDKTGLETIVDLAIGRFDLRNGSFSFGGTKQPLNGSGANFHAQLSYNALNPAYTGEIDINPLHLEQNGNTPLDVNIQLPVKAAKDRIDVANAQFITRQSHIVVSGFAEHLLAPHLSAHVNAQVALDEVRSVAGLTNTLDLKNSPRVLMADVTASMAPEGGRQTFSVQSARVTLGKTSIEGSGRLSGGSVATFNASLDLGELGHLLKVAVRPEGTVTLGGTVRVNAENDYTIGGNLEARQVAFRQGDMRIAGVNLDSGVTADKHRIALANLRLNAMGGRFAGAASLQDMAAFQVDGRLQDFKIEGLSRVLLQRRLGYNGIISGPLSATGNIKDMKNLAARVNLAIAPAAAGGADIPVSGKLNADYSGGADTVTLGASYIALPHTRVDLAGQLGKQIQVKLVSKNFADFAPVGNIPVSFGAGGAANLNATVTGTLSAPKIAGAIAVNNFSVQGRPFTRFTTDLNASPSNVTLANAQVTRGTLQMQLSASAGLRAWSPVPTAPLRADATIRNADVRDILALAGESPVAASGAFTADAHIAGTIGSPTGTLDVSAANGLIEGEKFDTFTLQARMAERNITVPVLSLVAGASRIDASAAFQHPLNDLEQGSITATVNSNQVQLAQFQALVKDRPGLRGALTLKAEGNGNLHGGQFDITSLNANIAANSLAMEGKALGDLTATASSSGTTLHYDVTSNFAGSSTHINGQTDLNGQHQTMATAAISNMPVDRLLAIAGQRDIPISGTLAVNAQVSGTLQAPQAKANITVTNGAAYHEPFTRLQTDIGYSDTALDVPRFHLEDGAAYLDANLAFSHPANDLSDGDVRFHVNSNQIQLAALRAIKQQQPTLTGMAQLTADGVARLRKNAPPAVSTLNANLKATGISLNHQTLGDLTADATTRGNAIAFNLTSDLAHSNIKGSGTVELTNHYPVNAHLTLANVTYRGLSPLLSDAPPAPMDATLDGQVTITGPATDVAQLHGTMELTKLEAHSAKPAGLGPPPRINLDLKNSGNIVASLDHGIVTLTNFKLAGQDANLKLTGTAALTGAQALKLTAAGNVNLEILKAFSTDIYSSGSVTLNATVAGTAANPDVNGQLRLQKASFNMLDLPNGISNATGTVAFNGTTAYIQNIAGESGGGKVTLAGTVTYGGPQMIFRVQAAVNGVHVQYPDNITTTISANLSVNGTSASSLVTGTARIQDVSLHSGVDIGNALTQAAAPPSASSGATGPLAGMRFDVRIMTSPETQFRTSLTENLQADANLTLVGTPDNPGMIGRVTVTEGDVVFFGSKYTIDQGTISFTDPSKINPVLNIDLETTVQGIDVAVSVSGPVSKMKLSYRSDPPLQFDQIVSLLASGTTPTTDPVLAAHSPVAPQQSAGQSGASAVLGQVANPVSGRLQRLFGVSKLSIDPQIVGTTNTAQANLTLQQQISRSMTFTYVQDVTNSNSQAIRVEWEINPRYSAIASRDINGEFTVNLFYKKRFH